MTFKRKDNTVTLEMSVQDWQYLLFILGCAADGAARTEDIQRFWQFQNFINRLNNGNPNFTPYEIPEDFWSAKQETP